MPTNTDDQGRIVMTVQRDNGSGDVLRDALAPAVKAKTKKKRKKKRTDARMQLQIRVGAKLIENLDAAVGWVNYLAQTDEETRTSLALRAIARRMAGTVDGEPWEPGRTTADVLVGNRRPLLIRVSRETMLAIDKACAEAHVTRTVWVLDALLAELATVKATVDQTQHSASQAA